MGIRDEAASELCAQCGMCCDGTIFDFVPIEESEKDDAGLQRFTFEQRGETTRLAQPCPAHCGTACLAYADRPRNCRKYRCRVLVQLDEGTIDFDQAKARVQQARGAAAKVAALLPPGEDQTRARRMWQEKRDDWRENAEFFLLMAALNLILDTHFRYDHQKFMAMPEPD